MVVFDDGGAYLATLGSQGPNPTGSWQPWLGPPPHGDGEFQGIVSLAVDDRDVVYVVDHDNHRIQVFGADGSATPSRRSSC